MHFPYIIKMQTPMNVLIQKINNQKVKMMLINFMSETNKVTIVDYFKIWDALNFNWTLASLFLWKEVFILLANYTLTHAKIIIKSTKR